MLINNKFNLGQVVYCKVDPKQLPRIVTAMVIRESYSQYMLYELSTESGCRWFGESEISTEKDVVLPILHNDN